MRRACARCTGWYIVPKVPCAMVALSMPPNSAATRAAFTTSGIANLQFWDTIQTGSPNGLGLVGYTTTCSPPNSGPSGFLRQRPRAVPGKESWCLLVAPHGVCKALWEKGLRVPENISVAGFNDTEAAMWHPPLTTVRVFPEQISKRMVELLVNRITHLDAPPQHSAVPTELIKRESSDRCLPPREQAIRETSKDAAVTADL